MQIYYILFGGIKKGLAPLIGVKPHHFCQECTYAPVALELFIGEVFGGNVACGRARVFFIGGNLYEKLFAQRSLSSLFSSSTFFYV